MDWTLVSDATAAREQLLAAGVSASEAAVLDERDGGTHFGFDVEAVGRFVEQQQGAAGQPSSTA